MLLWANVLWPQLSERLESRQEWLIAASIPPSPQANQSNHRQAQQCGGLRDGAVELDQVDVDDQVLWVGDEIDARLLHHVHVGHPGQIKNHIVELAIDRDRLGRAAFGTLEHCKVVGL